MVIWLRFQRRRCRRWIPSSTDYVQLYHETRRFWRAEFYFSVQCLHDEFPGLIYILNNTKLGRYWKKKKKSQSLPPRSLVLNTHCWNVRLFITHSPDTLSEFWFLRQVQSVLATFQVLSVFCIMTNVLLADPIATSSPVNAPMDQDVADVQTFSFNFRGFSNVLELQHFVEGKMQLVRFTCVWVSNLWNSFQIPPLAPAGMDWYFPVF